MEQQAAAAVEDLKVNPLVVAKEDLDVIKSLKEAKKELLKLKLDLSQDKIKPTFPFENEDATICAKRLLLADIQSEIELTALLMTIMQAKTIENRNTHPETVFKDTAAMTVWLNHMTKLHATHCEQLFSHLPKFISNIEGRDELVRKTAKEAARCTVHKDTQAVAKSVDGQTLYCAECVPKPTYT
jgi:ERCC4-related helicase